MAEDYYQLLGVPRSADAKEIQRAYRKLAREYHPDVNKKAGAEDTFKRISEAYHVLSDPESRSQYDRYGPEFRQYAAAGREYASQASGSRGGGGGGGGGGRTRARPGPSGFSWSSAQSAAGPGGGSVDWDDLFGDVFGSMRGMDSEVELDLTSKRPSAAVRGPSSSPGPTAPARRTTSRSRPVSSTANASASPVAEVPGGRTAGPETSSSRSGYDPTAASGSTARTSNSTCRSLPGRPPSVRACRLGCPAAPSPCAFRPARPVVGGCG